MQGVDVALQRRDEDVALLVFLTILLLQRDRHAAGEETEALGACSGAEGPHE